MDEQEKPFDTVSIVLLMTIAGFSDAADLATDLIFPVPVIGQVVFLFNSFLISPLIWATIQGTFIMKTSGGRMSLGSLTNLIPVAGGLGNIANIPGSETITTFIAIMIANHPKAAGLAMVAGAAIATGGAGAAAAGASGGAAGATGAGVATTGAEVTAGAETAAAGAETGAAAGKVAAGAEEAGGAAETEAMGGKGRPEEPGTRASEREAGAPEEEISDEALGEEKNPFEKLQELTEKTPDSDQRREQDEDENVQLDDDTNEVNLKKAA